MLAAHTQASRTVVRQVPNYRAKKHLPTQIYRQVASMAGIGKYGFNIMYPGTMVTDE